MAYTSTDPLFRSLTDEEEEQFRQYALDNWPNDLSQWSLYHPVCRDEWRKRGIGPTERNP